MQVIVNPNRAVLHTGNKRHGAGAILDLDDDDVSRLVASGDVSIYQAQQVIAQYEPPPAPVVQVQPDSPSAPAGDITASAAAGTSDALTAEQVVQAFDNVAGAVISGELTQGDGNADAAKASTDANAGGAAAGTPARKTASTKR
jgi:hypothetical protein